MIPEMMQKIERLEKRAEILAKATAEVAYILSQRPTTISEKIALAEILNSLTNADKPHEIKMAVDFLGVPRTEL